MRPEATAAGEGSELNMSGREPTSSKRPGSTGQAGAHLPQHRAGVDMPVGGWPQKEVSPCSHLDVLFRGMEGKACKHGAHTGMQKLLEDVSGLRH